MKVLVVGGGGREHALCWAIRRDRPEARLLCAPGNAGIADLATTVPISASAVDELVDLARRERVDLTIVGPEAPLAAGLADRLRAAGVVTFGPSAAAAQIEASKAFAKDVMAAAAVPTAASRAFTELTGAIEYIDRHPEPLVVKADGLAAGKGAVVCETRAAARGAAEAMLRGRALGDAGQVIVIESFLVGEELSVLALANPTGIALLPAAQDHKRLLEGDRGPNTGGMGAYSPVSLETPELLAKVRERVLLPTLAELARRGAPFSGLLYAGLMVDPGGDPWVVEFNCRFGDPETQVILPRIESGLVAALLAAARDEPFPPLRIGRQAAVATVLAAAGYPDQPEHGAPIAIPADLPNGSLVFHAGTTRDGSGVLRTAGGRVLTVTGVGATFADAQSASRAAAERITFAGKQFRPDIGWREISRRQSR